MNKKRTGFTLPEILMTLVIAGFLAVLTVQAINVNRTAYTSLTYYAFNNLKSAVGELIIPETQGENVNEATGVGDYTEMCLTVKDAAEKGETPNCAFEFEERIIRDDINLCEGMSDIMNTQGNVSCTNRASISLANLDNNPLPSTDLGNPDFRTTNGQKYYFWGRTAGEPNNGKYGYRIVAIDVNGDGAPNSPEAEGSLPPDIIAFAVLDSGEILPVGIAANNCKLINGVCDINKNTEGKTYNYLTSKINAFRFKEPNGSDIPAFCEKTGTCDYDKVYLTNETTKKVGFSFRQAYCGARITDDDVTLDSYCSPVEDFPRHKQCPPYDSEDPKIPQEQYQFDTCKQEIIKPMFRFNFN